MFTFLCQWFDCFGLDSREYSPEVQGKGKVVAVVCVCVCTCVCMNLCIDLLYLCWKDVVGILGLWQSNPKTKLSERMISESRQVFIQRAHKPQTDLDLTHHCWLHCLQPSSFIFTPHSLHITPSTPLSFPLYTSHSINKQLKTITVTLSHSPLKHAAVEPPPAALHHQSSYSTLTGTGGQMWVLAGWEVEESAVISAMCRTVICWSYKHRWTAALQACDSSVCESEDVSETPQINCNNMCPADARNLSKILQSG